jgi:hypothetical protein
MDCSEGLVEKLPKSLLVARGYGRGDKATPEVLFESAPAMGEVWELDQLRIDLGFEALAGVFRQARFTIPVEQAICVMVFNRLCDGCFKLGTLSRLQTVCMPSIDPSKIADQHLLPSVDALMDHQGSVDDCLVHRCRPLNDEGFALVFFDRTTTLSQGLSVLYGDVRHIIGMSKNGIVARQFMLGVGQIPDDTSIDHEVFDGATAGASTM